MSNRLNEKVAIITGAGTGVVVTFLAVMELVKECLIEIVQTEPFGPMHVTGRQADVPGS